MAKDVVSVRFYNSKNEKKNYAYVSSTFIWCFSSEHVFIFRVISDNKIKEILQLFKNSSNSLEAL